MVGCVEFVAGFNPLSKFVSLEVIVDGALELTVKTKRFWIVGAFIVFIKLA